MARSEFDIKLESGKLSERAFANILDGELVFECKSDRALLRTGNIFIEFRQGTGRTPSGIHPKSTSSSYWATEMRKNQWLIMPVEDIRAIARMVFKIEGSVIGGDNLNEGGYWFHF